MGFFEPLPAADDEEWEVSPRRQPEWAGPPDNIAGGTVVLDVVLANTGDAAVTLRGARAFPTGVLLRVGLFRRPIRTTMNDSFERFRFGVALPDGRKLTDRDWHRESDPTAALVQRGGGGGGLAWTEKYWLWPLPPPGRLLIACEWTPEGIAETVVEVDTAPIREAAGRAVELWPDERPVS